jgi:hypothetical protein
VAGRSRQRWRHAFTAARRTQVVQHRAGEQGAKTMKTCATCGVPAPATAKRRWTYCPQCRNDFKFRPGHRSYVNTGKTCPLCSGVKAAAAATCGWPTCVKTSKRGQVKKKAGKYGLSKYAVLVMETAERCECCGDLFEGGADARHIDHDHATGRVRGVVCRWCNLTLGNAKENEARLLACVDYLRGAKISGDIRGGL